MNIRAILASIQESLRFSVQSIRSNLLRTLLSLSGITIGVFCIISILTLVDSIEINIQGSISKLGDRVIFVQKWPWIFSSDYPWWKYVNRPSMKYREMELLEKKLPEADAVACNLWIFGKKISIENNTAEDVTLRVVSQEYDKTIELTFEEGRYFSEAESQRGEKVVILGNELAKNLFKNPKNAIGKKINLFNRKLRVIGILEKEGQGLGMDGGQDLQAMLPFNFVRNFGNFEEMQNNTTILVKASKSISLDAMEDEIRGSMRAIRKLHPRQEDNFSLNRITMLSNFLTGIFGKINIYGWVIAGFSILVGGFGIANIMFVSVKERTHIIGIQKALGAKDYFIMIQFLGEAVMLCVLGGVIGLTLIFLISLLLNLVLPFQIVLTFKNVMVGIGLSSLIGVIPGYIPSRQAAKLDPIEAIRFRV